MGAKTYKLVRSLVAPEDPKDKSYEDLAKLLQDHFMPKPSAIVQRFKFNTRSQQPSETIAMFLAELRHLSEHCEFGITLERCFVIGWCMVFVAISVSTLRAYRTM